jgi:TonB family protein
MDARNAVRAGLGVMVVSAALCGSARADDDLPSYRVLSCATKCANVQPAQAIDKPTPHLPDVENDYTPVEGFVEVRYTIGIDGHVRETSVARLIGPDEFALAATDAVSKRTFKPATVDGKPVETTSTITFDYKLRDAYKGARPDIAGAFNTALHFIREGKLDEALAKLAEAQARKRLNFFERTMIAYAQALAYTERKDYLTALECINLALIHGGADLDPKVRGDAIRLRVKLDMETGAVAAGLAGFEYLKKIAPPAADDPIVDLVAQARANADKAENIFVQGRIPATGISDAWGHTLYRRSYVFANVVGRLDTFRLVCDQESLESPVSAAAEWHVPKDWSNCGVFVRGTPGTTFDLVEED